MDHNIAELMKSLLLLNSWEKRHNAFLKYILSMPNDDREKNKEWIETLNVFFDEQKQEKSKQARELQQKREYKKLISFQEIPKKREKYYDHPAICKNITHEFKCETCGRNKNDSMAIIHKSENGWRHWCIECPPPIQHLEHIKRGKLYDEYMEMRNANGLGID